MPLLLRCDRVLIWVFLTLTIFGLVMVYSTTVASGEGYLRIVKQLIAATIGFASMYALMFLDYRLLRKERVVNGVVIGCIGLLLVAAVIGTGANTRRFLRLGFLSVQPSELAKLATILFLAFHFAQTRERAVEWRTYLKPVAVLGAFSGLILIGRDFGTMACLLLIAMAMLFVAKVPLRYLLPAVPAAVPVFYFFVWLEPYRRQRIFAFLDPEADRYGSGYQILQSKIAVGSGGVLGQGWLAGNQKMDFLPEPHTDYIFAVASEELGLIGAVLIVLCFMLILQRGRQAALGAPDLFGVYLATGITVMIVSQAMLNITIVLGLLPPKGMPLPFVSYGGTSLITMLAASGVLLNISRFGRRQV